MTSRDLKRHVAMEQRTQEALRSGGNAAMQEVNARIREILDKAPSDSTAELEIRKDKNGFQGLLKIFSQQRKFVGGSRGKTFADVIEHIFQEVRDQISDWKAERDIEFETSVK